MRVVVTSESRFSRTPDGRVWVQAGPDYAIWRRYLVAFDRVRIAARTLDVPEVPEGAARVDGDGVEVWPLPYYVGPRQYVLRRRAVARSVVTAADRGDAVILRVPSPIGSLLAAARERARLPYALEVIGDPYDVLAPGVVRHPLRPVLRASSTRRLRQQCRSAAAVAYETERHLQRRYPALPATPTAGISSVDLPAVAFVPNPRPVRPALTEARLVSIGSLEQLYKGIDTLVAALAHPAGPGPRLRLVHVGAGAYRPHLEQLADRLGVTDRVTFAGVLPTVEDVRRHLDAADLFVMPSRTEGLPRALIEAMARALPAIGSTAGGIPELLAPADLVPPDDPAALAAALGRMVTDPDRLAAASARNLARARQFSAETLDARRADYYRAVAEATERRGWPARGLRVPAPR
ncbi:glycosyltransferase [Micromonospora sp. C28SCA-DRY-2]|uniref:glycosyltransferase n=1 Tax=Micromonospora sp. C28SCA-DRY-2 TaxID=3059522 RepID=UPI002677400B|nr:glycosyltransferase [Micromonospora sp. C28SCA-DRY-2]MDO3705945.1 glycosyltransferase [Micromonospora sp. C28SCA-DRY-2]